MKDKFDEIKFSEILSTLLEESRDNEKNIKEAESVIKEANLETTTDEHHKIRKNLAYEIIDRSKRDNRILDLIALCASYLLICTECLTQIVTKLGANEEIKTKELNDLKNQIQGDKEIVGFFKEYLEYKRREFDERDKWS